MTTAFATGTRILTARGQVAVEALRDGDAIETVFGAFRPVVSPGHRRVGRAQHPKPRDARPVCVRADAFANGVPERDLLLSPDHAVYIDDVLIPICCLINGETIVQETTDEIVYWQVELPAQDIIFAEGLPCESYPPADSQSGFEDGGNVVWLFPGFASIERETGEFSRLTVTGERLATIRRYLLGRAGRQTTGGQPDSARGKLLPG
jgi:hypothetical protein